MVKTNTNILLLILFLISVSFAQTNNKIYEQNENLKKLKSEIDQLEKQLDQKEEQELESLKILDKINEQKLLLNKLINKLKAEEKLKERQITGLRGDITSVENRVKYLKDEYAKYIVWLYKNGQSSKLTFLFNSETVKQAIFRYKYLRSITQRNEDILKELNSRKEQLTSLTKRLSVEVAEKEQLVAEKKSEERKLVKKKGERENLLTTLKDDQQSIEQAIRQKQQAEVQIKALVAKLIEEERERQARLREAKLKNQQNSNIPDYSYDSFENFAQLRGKMNWPITSGDVFRKFGENRNEKLNTVTLNYGIDIKADSKSEVLAVAEGIVSAVDWIPGYGSVMIITHRDNFRTVYGHLSDIYVDEGAKVVGGTKIAKVTDSFEGRVMHFEIWNERNYQNPLLWLVKRK